MSADNQTMYKKRLKIRDDLEASEQADIKSCIDNKDPSCFPPSEVRQQMAVFNPHASLFNVRCFSNGSKLVLRLPEEGNVSLMDILGRRIMSRSISKDIINNDVIINTRLPRGIYIVKFKGAAVTEHKVINVL
jgi:hypothetical protein